MKNDNQEQHYKTIIAPHISEKASIATEKRNEYVFYVASKATKSEIKAAIEFIFKTSVQKVCVLNVIAKSKTFKGKEGKRSGWKKAYVKLAGDQKLEMATA